MRDPGESLIRCYDEYFNARRFVDAAALIGPECEFDHRTTREHAHGPRGFALRDGRIVVSRLSYNREDFTARRAARHARAASPHAAVTADRGRNFSRSRVRGSTQRASR